MQTIRLLIQLLGKQKSQRRIAAELQLSRNTVKQYAGKLSSSGISAEALLKLDDASLAGIVYAGYKTHTADARRLDFEQRIEYFTVELRRRGVTRQLLWEEYKQECPDGYEYSQFSDLLSRYVKVNDAVMHFSYKPAEVMMIDFAGDTLGYTDRETGEIIYCPVFIAVLPYSGYSYAVALPDAKQPSVIRALNECLDFFGGVPQSLKCDNMRQAVSKSCRYEPVFTETLEQWALHNNIGLTTARVRKPRDKAPVESEVRFVYQRVYAPLRNTVSFSIGELNTHIREQLNIYHQRPFQKKEHNRLCVFSNDEQPLLQKLPPSPFLIHHRVTATVQKNYHIILGEDKHQYSVPAALIGKQVQVIYDADTVEIYLRQTRVAVHRRSYRRLGYTTLADHMTEAHRCYTEQQGWDEKYFLEQAALIGPATHSYTGQLLKGRHFVQQAYHACLGLLRLARSYGPERVEAACRRALKGSTFSYKTIERILHANLDQLDQNNQPSLFDLPVHDNLRGPEAYT
jgi:transposase